MNRMEEYRAMLAELETLPPETEGAVERAAVRRNRKRYVFRPMGAVAAVFACFVLLVNLVPGVAYACSNIPILDKLAEFVSFSPSLRQVVEHGQVQSVAQTQSQNGITATIESLIVDQKQVIVYFTLDSEEYDHLSATVDAHLVNGEDAKATIVSGMPYTENGELQSATVNFIEGASVPDQLRVTLYVFSQDERGFLVEGDLFNPEFTLDLEPWLTGQGRTVMPDLPLDFGGQYFTLTQLECYPTHVRVNLKADPDNTAKLDHLSFYLELPDGTRLNAGSADGLTATGSAEGEMGLSLYAESSYFYDADRIKLVVTGATFLDKDAEKVWVDLTTGEHDLMPFDGHIDSIEKTDTGWELQIVAREPKGVHGGLFSWEYTAPDGTTDMSGHMGYSPSSPQSGYGTQFLYVDNYAYDEVYLTLKRTDEWIPENPLTVMIDMK